MKLLLTCEHGGPRVPARWRSVLDEATARAAGHRGHDAGALAVAERLSRRFSAPLVAGTTTRLLVDLNRSPSNPRRFSIYTRSLPRSERDRLDAELLAPHRARVEAALDACLREDTRVLHVAVHSFVPQLDGDHRDYDIGLLYDPARRSERRLAARWLALLQSSPDVQGVRRNAPYRGNTDGLTRHLRRRHSDRRYTGFELEINQRRLDGSHFDSGLVGAVEKCLGDLLAAMP